MCVVLLLQKFRFVLFIPFLCLNFIFIGLRRHKPWFWIFLIWSIGFSSTKYKVRIPREWYPVLIHYLTMLTNTLGSIFTCYIFADKTSFYGKTTGLMFTQFFFFWASLLLCMGAHGVKRPPIVCLLKKQMSKDTWDPFVCP